MVVGSSLVVQPAAQIPLVAKESGAKLVIINLDPTPLDSLADLVIQKRSGDVLQALP
jgi:NAD-dependent deacetylase